MEDGLYEVPRITVEPQVELPLVGKPVPRSLVYISFGIIMFLVFLAQEGVPPDALLWGGLAPSVALAAAYYTLKPERMTLDRWAVALWNYLLLPSHLVWLPSTAPEEPARAGGAAARELWGIDDE